MEPSIESDDFGYTNLNCDNLSIRTDFSGQAITPAIDVYDMMPDEQPTMMNTQTHIKNSSNIRIGPEIQYQAPVNFYVQNLRLDGNSGIAQNIKIPNHTNTKDKPKKSIYSRFSNLNKKTKIIISVVAASVLILIVILIILLVLFNQPPTLLDNPDPTSTESTTLSSDYSTLTYSSTEPTTSGPTTIPTTTTTTPQSTKNKIIKRDNWGALEPVNEKRLISPKYIVMGDIPRCGECNNKVECEKVVSNLQQSDILNNSFSDIRYNFLISPDGDIFEGTGFEYEGRHSFDFGATFYENSIGIFFLGNYSEKSITDSQKDAAQDLIEFGIEQEFINKEDYEIYNKYQLESGINRGHLLQKDISQFERSKNAVLIHSIIDWGGELSNGFRRVKEHVSVIVSPFPGPCDSLETCKKLLQDQQRYDKHELKLIDIRYNFVVWEKLVFAGRNWDFNGYYEFAKNDSTKINEFLHIGFIPDQNKSLTKSTNETIHDLIKQGKNIGKLNEKLEIDSNVKYYYE